MLYDSGFRPSSSVLGAKIVPIAASYPTSFISSYGPDYGPVVPVSPVFPVVTPAPTIITTGPAVAAPTPAITPTGWLALGALSIAGAVLLINALNPAGR